MNEKQLQIKLNMFNELLYNLMMETNKHTTFNGNKTSEYKTLKELYGVFSSLFEHDKE